MPLFQANVVKKYIADLPKDALHAAWQIFLQHFHNPQIQAHIREVKEEQYQEGFLRELFVGVLGYTLNPQPAYNLTSEYKNEKDSKKADGAVLKDGAVRAVIELKGTDTTDLGKIEKQAFGYLNNQTGCTYVITANFEKLRFYIQDATDFEEFNLFTLTKDRFALLYLCLQKDSLLADVPLQVKQQSVVQEDVVTKKLYADYSRFRSGLFQNMVALNPQHGKLELFQKTQKLLDRFLFIFFAEDRLLLPPNSVREILAQWEQLKELDNYVPLYDRFKKYFGYLNEGHKGRQYEIFPYNGGLFAADALLDAVRIDDGVLYANAKTLSGYDYNTEVDVNILGHIFEHSLNEIEQLQAEAGGAAMDKTASRRKKEGVFYTPRYITKYIVENTVGALCAEKKTVLAIVEEDYAPAIKKTKANDAKRKELNGKLERYRTWLLALTICDPACGSGAFLNAALEFLIAEHNYVDELTNKLMGSGTLEFKWTPNDILENNLYGVDINEEAVEIARLSLWLRTAQRGRKLSNLSSNIKVGNSLIDDKTIAGDKAFSWKEEFAAVFEKGGFDVVIGNPPYGAALSKDEKRFIDGNYSTALASYDTYGLFFEASMILVNINGFLGFITPNTYLVLESGEALRRLLFEQYLIVSFLETFNVFADAVVEPITTIIRNRKSNDNDEIKSFISTREDAKLLFSMSNLQKISYSYKDLFNRSDLIFNYKATKENRELSSKIEFNSNLLGNIAKVTAGVKPYEKGKGNPPQTEMIVQAKPFTGFEKHDSSWYKLIRGTQINRYSINWDGEFIKYGEWLAAPRREESFTNPKVVVRRTDDKILASLDKENYIGLNSIHCLQIIRRDVALEHVLSVINSRLLNWYFRFQNFHMVGKPLAEVKVIFVERLPIKIPDDQQPFIAKADIMLYKNKELHELKTGLLALLRSKYEGIAVSKKLADWPQLSFKDFLKELEKVKTKLSLPEQKEWLTYFESEKAKAAAVQTLIFQTDKEIDKMVYALYGLTEEEIKIVEG